MKYAHIIANSKGVEFQNRLLDTNVPVKMFKSLAKRNNAYYNIYDLNNNWEAVKTQVVKENK